MSNVVRDSPKYTTSITIEHMKLSIVLILFIVSISAFGQQIDTPRQVLDKILAHAKDASLYREKVNWDSLSKAVLALASNAKNVTDLGPSLKFLLKSLGDEHVRTVRHHGYAHMRLEGRGFAIQDSGDRTNRADLPAS